MAKQQHAQQQELQLFRDERRECRNTDITYVQQGMSLFSYFNDDWCHFFFFFLAGVRVVATRMKVFVILYDNGKAAGLLGSLQNMQLTWSCSVNAGLLACEAS